MILPHRVQRKRTKGWKMPVNTVYVGRPSKYANIYSIGEIRPILGFITREMAVRLYRIYLKEYDLEKRFAKELKGKNLACWCPLDKPCHADVLLEIAK